MGIVTFKTHIGTDFHVPFRKVLDDNDGFEFRRFSQLIIMAFNAQFLSGMNFHFRSPIELTGIRQELLNTRIINMCFQGSVARFTVYNAMRCLNQRAGYPIMAGQQNFNMNGYTVTIDDGPPPAVQ